MAKVIECNAVNCAYNKHNSCHTPAITVGGPEPWPQCDTFVTSPQAGGIIDMKAGVGACKVSKCSHNESLECNASTIKVGWQKDHAECKSFNSKM